LPKFVDNWLRKIPFNIGVFFIPKFETYIPKFGTYIPKFGMYIPRFGMEIS
jgi:hypothetical protein